MILPILLLGLLYFTTIFFGGAHVWSQSVLTLSLFLLTPSLLWFQSFKKSQNNRLQVSIIRDPVSLVGLFFLLWTALSLIPLPPNILKALSPKTFYIWEATSLVGGRFPHPLSLYPYMTLNSWVFGLSLLFCYGLVLYGIKGKPQIHFLVVGILVLGTLESIYALVQSATAQPYILWWKMHLNEDMATGTFINRNHLADFLAMIVCLGVGYLWALGKEHQEKNLPNKQALVYRTGLQIATLGTRGIVLLLLLALMIAALLTTASRGGTLALLAGLLFMGGLLGSRFFKSRKALILLIALSLICTYVGYVGLDRVLERFQQVELGFYERLAIAKGAYKMGRAFPLTGSGLGTFEFVYPGYQDYITDALMDYAHNDWVQLFAETGGIGLIIIGGGFLWFMGKSIALWRRRQDPFSIGLGLGGLGATMAVAVHSFMDFSLHIPAVALLLTVIIGITTLGLHFQGSKRQGMVSRSRSILKLPLWAAVPFLILLSFLSGALGFRTWQTWQADSLARTVWNSTLPYRDPSDSELIRAWAIAQGNGHYWDWLGRRVSQKPGLSLQMDKKIRKEAKDATLYLLGQGILRSPTAWGVWKDFSWAAFLKAVNEPEFYYPLATKASFQASRLRPYFFQGYLDCGMIGLVSYARQTGKPNKTVWQEAFNQALFLNPNLSPLVADQVLLYLGPNGAKELKGFLPRLARVYLLTSVFLLKYGIYLEGLEYLVQGEHYRERETERLWEELSQGRAESPEKRQKILKQLLTLDPQYPWALLTQGRVLEALNIQDRRVGVLGELGDRKELAWSLKLLEERKQGSVAEIAYFQGRLAEEEMNFQRARSQFRRTLEATPQFFPAWVHLEKILKQTQRSEGDRLELENLQKKLHLFEMDQVVGDAWTGVGFRPGEGQWKAPYRTSKKQEKMEIAFTGDSGGAWKLMLDGRFVKAWAGNKYGGEKKMIIPQGEHEFTLISYNETQKNLDKLPFKLNILFK
ncbi:MAG: O-antigen ligase family protein [Pseudomonadota bacterium]